MGLHGTLVLIATVGVIGVSCAWVVSATSLATRLPRRARLAIDDGLRRGNTYYSSYSSTRAASTRHAYRMRAEEAVTTTLAPVRALPATRRPYALEGAPTQVGLAVDMAVGGGRPEGGSAPTWGVESWSRAIAAYGALLQQAIEAPEPDEDATEDALTFEEVTTSFGANPLNWHSGSTGAWPFAA